MAIKMDGHAITALKLKASNGNEVTKQLTEEGTIPTPTETLDIRANGLIDVTHFKKVNVQVEGGGELPELTNPASASDIAKDKEAIDGSGNKIIGTNTFDADTSDADAVASDIAEGKTAYVNGVKLIGTASGGGVEVAMTAEDATNLTSFDKFANKILPTVDANAVYVVRWNGIASGATPVTDQVGFACLITNSAGVKGGAGCRYRGGVWATVNGLTATYDCRVSAGDVYTWYKV